MAKALMILPMVLLMLLVLTLIAPIHCWSDKFDKDSNENRLKICIDLADRVDSLKDYTDTFEKQFPAFRQMLSRSDLSTCLGIDDETDPFMHVSAIKEAIESGQDNDVCSHEYINNKLIYWYDTRIKQYINQRLNIVFDYYASKILSDCFNVVERKLKQVEHIKELEKSMSLIKSLLEQTKAINLNLQQPESKNNVMYNMSTDMVNLVSNYEVLEELNRLSSPIEVEVAYSEKTFDNAYKIRRACNNIFKYSLDAFYGIIELIRRGYLPLINYPVETMTNQQQLGDDSWLISWLAMAQICEVDKSIQARVLVDKDTGNKIAIRFKIAASFPIVKDDEKKSFLLDRSRGTSSAYKYDNELAINIADSSVSIRSTICPIKKSTSQTGKLTRKLMQIASNSSKSSTKSDCKTSHNNTVDRSKQIKSIMAGLYTSDLLQAYVKYLESAKFVSL